MIVTASNEVNLGLDSILVGQHELLDDARHLTCVMIDLSRERPSGFYSFSFWLCEQCQLPCTYKRRHYVLIT